MKQPSAWSVSPNKTMDPVTRHINYVQSYLNSSIVAKKMHVQDVQVCSKNDSWGKSSPCHASNEKFSPPLPVHNAKEADQISFVVNLLPPGAPWTTVLDNKKNDDSVTSSLSTPTAHCLSNAKEAVSKPLVINWLPPGAPWTMVSDDNKNNGVSTSLPATSTANPTNNDA